MIPYILINSYLFASALIKNDRILHYINFVVIFLICSTYYNGSDWRGYEPVYNSIESGRSNWNFSIYLIFSFFQGIGMSFHAMLLTCKLLVAFSVYRFIRKYSPAPQFAFSVFILLGGYYLFIDNPFRQMLAIPFVLWFFSSLMERNWIQMVLSLIIGTSFHSSVLLLSPLIILRSTMQKNSTAILFLIVIFLIMTITDNWLLYSSQFLAGIPEIGYYARHYMFEADSRIISGSSLIYLVIMIIYFAKRGDRYLDKYDFFGVLLFATIILSIKLPEMLRFSVYLFVPFAISLSHKLYGKKMVKLRGVVVFLCIVLSANVMLSSYKYFPYTNYVYSYLTNQEKSYSYRYNFHLDRYNGNN